MLPLAATADQRLEPIAPAATPDRPRSFAASNIRSLRRAILSDRLGADGPGDRTPGLRYLRSR